MRHPELSYAHADHRPMHRFVIRSMERAAGRAKLVRLYTRWRVETVRQGARPFHAMLDLMRIRLEIDGAWPVPGELPERLVVIANHPFGIGDGAAMLALAEKLGRPVRILISKDLMKIPEMAAYGLPVAFDLSKEAQAMNLQTRKEAMRLLGEGVTIVVFPAGGVATAAKVFGRADDLPWKQFAARLVRTGGASILPVHVHGQNGPLFHLVSKWSQTLRYGLLIGAFRRLYGRSIKLTVGAVIPHAGLSEIGDGKTLTAGLRRHVLGLAPPAPYRPQRSTALTHWLERRAARS
ncbi:MULTISPECIES: 1-acyl-sn-glycerol-3-phosphate acyltransferase [unclassified Aureimonas]|uniref:1-acyl-sn-glycerol-3-phosphate acyltransferase n=1 Tax=unclassified Aureimonas TaxID=2615206 RepID=UPI0006FD44E0|nr:MULTISPECIES: 1-acyl-sn-glycerol-3-phosphate acyltransferase [unclassified Aureimonas]KQT57497.1 glycerol acyltransferase [Aureimonas sp. Leaf427]KQT77177.1 glycerol acyltransferase [Aureimonas sp. Leaf460]